MSRKEYPLPIKKLLIADVQGSLDNWWADPLDRDLAEALLAEVRRALQQAYALGSSGDALRILEIIALFWLQRPVGHLYSSLHATPGNQLQHSLLELVYGQLLLSRRQAGAVEHLDAGFRLAAELLEAESYFALMKRHDLLRHLTPSTHPVEPQPLNELLVEARVIQRLNGRGTHRKISSHKADTLG